MYEMFVREEFNVSDGRRVECNSSFGDSREVLRVVLKVGYVVCGCDMGWKLEGLLEI